MHSTLLNKQLEKSNYKANMHVMNSNSKRHEEVWQDISDALAKEGYYFSHLQCEDKWKYLKKLYVDTVDKNKESGIAENTYSYFKEFHEIYGKSHSVNPPALASNRTVTNISEISSDSERIRFIEYCVRTYQRK